MKKGINPKYIKDGGCISGEHIQSSNIIIPKYLKSTPEGLLYIDESEEKEHKER